MGDSAEHLISAFDERLCQGVFFFGNEPVYEFRMRGPAGDTTWAWDPTNGVQRGRSAHPKCVVDMETSTAKELLSGETSPQALLSSGRLRVGGLVDAIEALGSVFAAPEHRGAITSRRADTVLVPHRRRRLAAEVEEKLAAIGTKAERERLRAFLHLWTENRIQHCRLDQWVRSPFPDLAVSPWGDTKELGIDDLLSRAHDGLVAEAKEFLFAVKAPHYAGRYETPDEPAANRPKGWRQWHIVSNFEFDSVHAARFPIAANVAREIARHHTILHAYYLILEPKVELPLHADGVDWAMSYHYGLIVPEGAYLAVAHETRHHAVGGSLLFNDSFVHRAGNTSDSPRIVFNVVLANPQLSATEREGIKCMVASLPEGAISYSR
ncbi:MAG TPA: aspartyl/asparaginyl beta-hydroxylase domain-containing protein [Labilithrix sp.]|nr:aspartyl/asparaginyl beta-hydroxylase domain-containing protein [Labilithrix sp.]